MSHSPFPPNQPKFEADRYLARPMYPRDLFRLIERPGTLPSDPIFLDLGCGTGQSTRSFLNLAISHHGFAVDPNLAMIDRARHFSADAYPNVSFREGSAEAIPIPDGAVDITIVGSAIHWFDLDRARPEIERVLKPGGMLFAFEYQFPKCVDDPVLAEKIRRHFNLEWKAPHQRPRGTLAELVSPFREDRGWKKLGDDRPPWTESLHLDSFLGHLDSQSRYLHAEAAANDPIAYRESIRTTFLPFFARGPLRFELKPRAILLRFDPSL